ncbi:cytochrome P450 [Trametopsis cervina]|nr:cytochrome P450 [Trametopsis cervina]
MAVIAITGYDWILLVIFLCLLTNVVRKTWVKQSTDLIPPGPPGLPLVGNAFQIPSDRQWLKFDQWIKEYGDVVHLNVTGQSTVVLGSLQAAAELLDNRGLMYSDRPPAVMAGELVGWNLGLGYSPGPHSPRFREFRRMFQQFMGPRAAQDPTLLLAQTQNAAKLMLRLLDGPEEFITHVRQSTGALILRLAFGYEVSEDHKEDKLVKIAETAMQGFARASEPGTFLVDTIPVLKHVPSWFPGAGFQKEAARMRRDREELYDVPYDFVKSCMGGTDTPTSFVSFHLTEKEAPTAEREELIKAAAASLYSGGADTTPSSLASFILAMTLYPHVQARAQAEVESVIGPAGQRLPSFSDRPHLPYVEAIVLELLRWNPAVPLGLAHQLTQDDVYRGYRLKKGTVVWANIWTMLHDETVFPRPLEFRPERFLDKNGAIRPLSKAEDPNLGFGFGRRICPGMYFADNSIFIAVAMMLGFFNISKATDENGREIIPEVEYDGFISHPRPFKCNIKPRSSATEALIRDAAHRM